ncbi:MAG: hypothetical protein ACKVIM_00315 [Flavobacteriales bacterium]
MLKSIIYIILSTVFIFSILAPSVINLYSNADTIVLLDSSEKEKSEKTEKELEEKILNLYTFNNKSTLSLKKRATFQFHIEINTDHTLKVLLPPPKQNI